MTTIFVRTRQAGIHHWPQAPIHRKYLGVPHRHLFHIEARCAVDHRDREVEFHDVLDQLNRAWEMFFPDGRMGSCSCEQAAAYIAEFLSAYFKRQFLVIVSEDGECGAEVQSAG